MNSPMSQTMEKELRRNQEDIDRPRQVDKFSKAGTPRSRQTDINTDRSEDTVDSTVRERTPGRYVDRHTKSQAGRRTGTKKAKKKLYLVVKVTPRKI